MSTLQTRGFAQIVGSIAAGMQGRVTTRFLNFAIGSMLRGIAEAYAGVLMWLQALALNVARLTRLSTSYGPDADSWLADFGITTRLGAQAATGLVVYSRLTASAAQPVIPVGALVQTQNGSIRFVVYADPTNPLYSSAVNGYVVPAQVVNAIVPVQCVTSGVVGNIAAAAITLQASSVPGMDTVTNPGAFTNGLDSESDDDVKARFRLDVQALSKGTRAAIMAAVKGVRVGMQVTVTENTALDGSPEPGFISVVVDDGSGNCPPDIVAACRAAVTDDVIGVRAATIRVGLVPASITYANVTMQIASAPGYYHPNVVAAVSAALAFAINGLGLGSGLPFYDLSAYALAVPGCAKVLAMSLNGSQADIPDNPTATVKAGSLVIS